MWHSAYDRGWDQTPVEWIPFYRGPKFPDAPGAPDEVEEPGADSLWMWPDSNPPHLYRIDSSTRVAIPLS